LTADSIDEAYAWKQYRPHTGLLERAAVPQARKLRRTTVSSDGKTAVRDNSSVAENGNGSAAPMNNKSDSPVIEEDTSKGRAILEARYNNSLIKVKASPFVWGKAKIIIERESICLRKGRRI